MGRRVPPVALSLLVDPVPLLRGILVHVDRACHCLGRTTRTPLQPNRQGPIWVLVEQHHCQTPIGPAYRVSGDEGVVVLRAVPKTHAMICRSNRAPVMNSA